MQHRSRKSPSFPRRSVTAALLHPVFPGHVCLPPFRLSVFLFPFSTVVIATVCNMLGLLCLYVPVFTAIRRHLFFHHMVECVGPGTPSGSGWPGRAPSPLQRQRPNHAYDRLSLPRLLPGADEVLLINHVFTGLYVQFLRKPFQHLGRRPYLELRSVLTWTPFAGAA